MEIEITSLLGNRTHARHFLTKTWYIDFVYKNHSFIHLYIYWNVSECVCRFFVCVFLVSFCVHFIWWTYQIKCSLKRTEVVFVRLTWTIFLSTSHILARIIYNYLHMLFAFILVGLRSVCSFISFFFSLTLSHSLSWILCSCKSFSLKTEFQINGILFFNSICDFLHSVCH